MAIQDSLIILTNITKICKIQIIAFSPENIESVQNKIKYCKAIHSPPSDNGWQGYIEGERNNAMPRNITHQVWYL